MIPYEHTLHNIEPYSTWLNPIKSYSTLLNPILSNHSAAQPFCWSQLRVATWQPWELCGASQLCFLDFLSFQSQVTYLSVDEKHEYYSYLVLLLEVGV